MEETKNSSEAPLSHLLNLISLYASIKYKQVGDLGGSSKLTPAHSPRVSALGTVTR
jgi:hypothetical protein